MIDLYAVYGELSQVSSPLHVENIKNIKPFHDCHIKEEVTSTFLPSQANQASDFQLSLTTPFFFTLEGVWIDHMPLKTPSSTSTMSPCKRVFAK